MTVNPNTGLPYSVYPQQVLIDAEPVLEGYEGCQVCGRAITVMAFRKTGVCCEICRKKRMGEPYEEKPLAP